jgi:hypothetical protein
MMHTNESASMKHLLNIETLFRQILYSKQKSIEWLNMRFKTVWERENDPMVSTSQVRLLLFREELEKIRRIAIRRDVWYKTLNKAERALIELTIRIVKKIRSFVLNRVLTSIIEKLQASLEGRVAVLMRKVGQPLAQKISLIAQSWGSVSAVRWKSDQSFVKFLAVMYMNTPTVFRDECTYS